MTKRRLALHAAASVLMAFELAGCDGETPPDCVAAADLAAQTEGLTDEEILAAAVDLGECCASLEDFCESAHPSSNRAYETCVFGPDVDGSTGCIPWGPPVPPKAVV